MAGGAASAAVGGGRAAAGAGAAPAAAGGAAAGAGVSAAAASPGALPSPHPLSLYHVFGRIGEGTYGVVYVATTLSSASGGSASSAAGHPPQKRAELLAGARGADNGAGGSLCALPHVADEDGAAEVGHPRTGASSAGTQRKLALKLLKPTKEFDGVSPTAVREMALLRELNHPHVLRLEAVHVHVEEHVLCMVFNYAEYDLYELIRHHRERLAKSPISLHTVKSLLWQVLQGVEYLHSQWVIHRDLKPSNILVTSEIALGGGGMVKIADFGLARIFQAPLRPLHDNGVVVTIWYRAPELLLGARHYTPALDVWAVGCIFAELTALRPLFQGHEVRRSGAPFQKDQLMRICELLGAPTEEIWPTLGHLPHWAANDENVVAAASEASNSALAEARKRRRLNASTPTPGEPPPLLADAAAMGRGSSAHYLLSKMLTFDPSARLTAQGALNDTYFSLEPIPGRNALRPPEGTGAAVSYPPRRVHTEDRGMPQSSEPAQQQQRGNK